MDEHDSETDQLVTAVKSAGKRGIAGLRFDVIQKRAPTREVCARFAALTARLTIFMVVQRARSMTGHFKTKRKQCPGERNNLYLRAM